MSANSITAHSKIRVTAYEGVVVAIVTLIGAALRLWAIDIKPLWIDEAFSVWVANLPLRALLDFVATVDHHPPLYYLLLHAWQGISGDSQGAVRIPSAILGAAAIPPFYYAGRILVGRYAALLSTLLLALSPFHVRYGQEARMYALLTFLAALLFCSLAIWLVDSAPRTGRRRLAMIGLVLAESLLLYTHNMAVVLIPISLNLAVLIPWIRDRGRSESALPAVGESHFLVSWLTGQAVVLLLWLPWLPHFLLQAATVYRDFWIDPLTFVSVWQTFHNFILTYPEGWLFGPLWDVLYWASAIVGVWALRRKLAIALLLSALFVAPAVVAMLISIQRPVLYDRALIWTTLSYYLLVGVGLAHLLRSVRQPAASSTRRNGRSQAFRQAAVVALSALLILVLPLYSLYAYYTGYEKEDWPALVDYMTVNADVDDLVLFSASWSQIPFEYYAGADIHADVHGLPYDLFESGELEATIEESHVQLLEELANGHDEVWLIYAHEWYTDPDGIVPVTLANQYELVDEREFAGPRVLHFSRPNP